MFGRTADGFRSMGKLALVGFVVFLLAFMWVISAYADSTYRVQPGDTLISIAARYGVTVDAIVVANSLPSRSTIYSGQTLIIPSPGSQPAPPKPPSGQGGTYLVQAGDTLGGIAGRYGTTVSSIIQANNLSSTIIYVGQRLTIPTANTQPSGQPAQPTPTQQPPKPTATQKPQQPAGNPTTYTVKSGDSLIGVARKFGITHQALAAANGLGPTDYLYVGQVLKIPGVSQPTQPPATATNTITKTAVVAGASPTVQPTTTPQTANADPKTQAAKPIQYTVQFGDNLSSIAAKFNTTVDAIVELNNLSNRNYLSVGQVLTIVKGNDQDNNAPTPPAGTPIPEPMGEKGPKWIDVNISTQMVVAYEGETEVYSSKVSTGVPRHPTVEGTYRIYAKYRSTLMQGAKGTPEYYYIPNVPYTMYFYSGYALHGAFWHNNFGRPMSHGCVNLPVDVAKWFYEWAPIGTKVITHR